MTNEIDIAEDALDEDLDSSTEVGEEAGEESRALHEESDTEESATVPVTQMPVDAELLRKIIEGAILAAGQPMTIARLLELFDEEVAPSKDEIAAALLDIQAASAERGFELKEVASGWRFQVRDNLAPWVNRLWEEKPQKYSRALLETLALVAYRQPITRGDIEEIRGVAVSSHIMKTLLERDWVKVVGHRDVPGRPSLFATTRQFLDYFNLKSLEELPSLSEIRDLDELNPVLDLGEAGLGEKDTDPPIPDENPPVAASEVDAEPVDTQAAFYEEGFVDGEDAFVDVEEDAAVADSSDTETINNEEEPRSD
ncbi:SMC-Scp complex subunit ScpB [Cellvibrio fibrivorans]|uniref:Segregation and condensation protein B n=1 Tax=Cellvibrio fibrivorans TaxID=126350 RepID=A0ABU1UWQ2_9GAMM|nr:SMC-Scp complex subunit ScpB [Cellvibrio fibrivorans]MDR7089557.1 segregation and condensation protein B [Cellvibrio fibrivorans]